VRGQWSPQRCSGRRPPILPNCFHRSGVSRALLSPANWVRYWRPEIQGYIHAYRAVTGADLTDRVDTTMPAVLLKRRAAPQALPEGARAALPEPRRGLPDYARGLPEARRGLPSKTTR